MAKLKLLKKLPKWAKEIIEQLLHFCIGFGPIGIAIAYPSWWTGLIAGFIIGGVREWDQRPVERWWDTVLDLFMVSMGGAIAGYLFGG